MAAGLCCHGLIAMQYARSSRFRPLAQMTVVGLNGSRYCTSSKLDRAD